MRKFLLTLFGLALLLFACNPKEEKNMLLKQAISIQENARAQLSDSSYDHLKKVEGILAQMDNVPDSLYAENNYLLGLYFKERTKMDSAAIYFHNATDFVNDSITKTRQGSYFESAWNTYMGLGKYGDCISISKKFKSLIDPKTQKHSMAWVYYWEQSVYTAMGDYSKVQQILDQRVDLARSSDSLQLPSALTALADFTYDYLKDKKKTFEIYEEILADPETLSVHDRGQAYTNLGVFYFFENEFDKSLECYLLGLRNTKQYVHEDKINSVANAYANIAEVLLELKRFPEAEQYLDSIRLLGVSKLARRKQKQLLDYEYRFALETNQSNKRFQALLDQIYQVQDESYRQKLGVELLELTKSNEKQIALTKEKQAVEISNIKLKTRSIILLAGSLLLGTIGILFYQRRKFKFEKRSLQIQQRLLRSQMNPHFTFNTLYAIQTEIKKNQQNASDYLMKFSRLLRLILENSTQNYVQLDMELEALKKYMDLKLLESPNKFTYEIELKNLEEDDLIFIPPMLLQPFIENSIEHGFSNIDFKGKIILILELKNKFIHCSIEDNGKGMIEKKSDYKYSTSIKLISEFLQKATKSEIKITNKAELDKNKMGVLVEFMIPFRHTEND